MAVAEDSGKLLPFWNFRNWPGGGLMYLVAAVLTILSGLFYAANHHEIGRFGVEMCRYGGAFCDSPIYVLAGAGLAAAWGAFVSVR
jgi:hypothetical protein